MTSADPVATDINYKSTADAAAPRRKVGSAGGTIEIVDCNNVPMSISSKGKVEYVSSTVTHTPAPSDLDVQDWDDATSGFLLSDSGVTT